MAIKRLLEEDSPDEIRDQLARQLMIDSWRLAPITDDGLYRLRDQLAVDELTGVFRRRAGLAELEREVERAKRSRDRSLVLVFLDLEGLKSINDNHGHAAGDAALRRLAAVLKSRLRSQDLIFRYGGDEFVCVLPEAGIEAAQTLMLQIWHQLNVEGGPGFSAGFADLREDDSCLKLIARADDCLYLGRRPGRSDDARSRPPSGTYALRRAHAAGG